ncbi:hypothetical protein ACFVAV_33435 [Nocardia sp. NPDC057663]|uniref:hypothetical protein n=1 Tax=Nocardia sp. NPDC057663 TaxID=3346201 RepID=UPI003672FB99
MSLSDHHNGAGDPGAPDGAELYGTGPWAVVESAGPLAHGLTARAVAQCEERGVRYEVLGIDKLGSEDIGVFHGVVVTTPDHIATPADVAQRLEAVRVIRTYRAIRREGIEAVVSSRRLPEYKAGVLQVAGRSKVLNQYQFKQLSRSVCREHRIDTESALGGVDFFSMYVPGTTIAVMQSQTERYQSNAWKLLLQWGIPDAETALAVRQIFEECIRHYEDPRYKALFRPILGKGLNRLQFVLTDPGFHGPTDPGAYKKWMENGARVGRHVLDQLSELDPAITRPGGGARGLQDELYRLYVTTDTLVRTPEFRAMLPPAQLPTEEGPPPTATVHE